MLKGFRQFVLRGNVIDLAVAVVIGGAFGAVVTALVKDLLTPLIAALVGKPDFSAIVFTVNGSQFPIGDFINAVVSFVLITAAIYFFIGPCMALVQNPEHAYSGVMPVAQMDFGLHVFKGFYEKFPAHFSIL